jgi:cytochrome c oxidase subunit II
VNRTLNGIGRKTLGLASTVALLALALAGAGAALAAQPVPGGIGLQPPATEVAEHIGSFKTLTMWIIVPITLFVLALLIYVGVKFNANANKTPSKVTHHTGLEIAWTVIPILILAVLAVPSFRLLYEEAVIPKSDMTLKVVGHAWYWEYVYPDHGDIKVDALMLEDADRTDPVNQPRLLSTDNYLIIPVGKTVRVEVTAADVIHSWYVPSFGVQMYAIPGRLNETWFKAEKAGKYYGQCNMICGARHAYMPIAIHVVTDEQFAAWTEAAKTSVPQANKLLQAMIETEQKKVAALR